MLIYFTRNRIFTDTRAAAVEFDGVSIQPNQTAKILGVILDKELCMKQHISYAASKAITQYLAVKRIKGLPPRAVRQLYTATVTAITDYAASTWYRPQMKGIMKAKKDLDAIQRLGAQAIIGAFRTVSLSILEAEADLMPIELRLRNRVANHWTNMYTLPSNHPFWTCRTRLEQQGRRFLSPFAAFH